MAQIILPNEHIALIDDADIPIVQGYSWYAHLVNGTWYAKADKQKNKIRTRVRMHRLILGVETGIQVDHINGNGLDNRRGNLRIATNSQQRINSRKRKDGKSSQYKGVIYDKWTHRWSAKLGCNGQQIWLGRFDSEIEAAKAYDAAAREHFGEYARLNFD